MKILSKLLDRKIPIPPPQKEYKIRGTSSAIICFLFFFRHTINLTMYT